MFCVAAWAICRPNSTALLQWVVMRPPDGRSSFAVGVWLRVCVADNHRTPFTRCLHRSERATCRGKHARWPHAPAARMGPDAAPPLPPEPAAERLLFDALSALVLLLTALLGAHTRSSLRGVSRNSGCCWHAGKRVRAGRSALWAIASSTVPAATPPFTARCASKARNALSHNTHICWIMPFLCDPTGAYLPRYLASRGSQAGGGASSLAFHLGNMLSGGGAAHTTHTHSRRAAARCRLTARNP